MKALKSGQFLIAILVSVLIIFCIPFVFDGNDQHDKIIFDFSINRGLIEAQNSGLFSQKVTEIVYKTVYYGLLSLGSIHMILSFTTLFVKKRGTKIFITSLIILEIVLMFPTIILMSQLSKNEFYKGIFIYLAASFIVLNVLFALVQAVYQIITLKQLNSPQIIVPQKTEQGIVYSADQVEDSIEIKNRIKDLKNGLVSLSYDEALETIDATGEWHGLDMKDVKDYSYQQEILQNQQELQRVNEKEIGGKYNSFNNGLDLDKWKR